MSARLVHSQNSISLFWPVLDFSRARRCCSRARRPALRSPRRRAMTLPHRSGREAQLGACGAGVGQLESVKKPPDTNTKECADDHVHELRPGEFGRLYAEEPPELTRTQFMDVIIGALLGVGVWGLFHAFELPHARPARAKLSFATGPVRQRHCPAPG